MGNELAIPDDRLDLARLAEVPTERLLAELHLGLRLTADYVVYLAHVWAEIEARGVDLQPLRRGLALFLTDIAQGRVLAEVVIRYMDQPRMLKAVAAMPLDEQRRIADGAEPVLLPPSGRSWARRKDGPAEDALAMLAAGRAEDARSAPSFVDAARNAAAGDLADLLVLMLTANPAAADVARRILPRVEALARSLT